MSVVYKEEKCIFYERHLCCLLFVDGFTSAVVIFFRVFACTVLPSIVCPHKILFSLVLPSPVLPSTVLFFTVLS